ncbi:hypothetical protein DMH12_01295 [Streptomyces sp. WAC 04229]|uniref:DUF4303 domain-containing protein n=1 Tax=Streptomyces sp. WAC 04229 TaxID=2203206 RepID=UPI000F742C2F|nr:DUF4303 domain-containing protein [Streptomyces sp. WAC 04229]RSN66287.1 hypothetical protein DMH12_01295 [Streptomyces sp. WAC 04229]
MPPTEAELADAVHRAARAALLDLFREHPGDRFYYFTLVTSGEAYGPALSAWSVEALAAEAARQGCAPTHLKWSYADSPFCCYGERHLEPVRPLFEARGELFDLPDDEADAEFDLRLRAMETAVARLDAEGLFGTGSDRHSVVVTVEVPSEAGNDERVLRLNPPQALTEWRGEAAVAEDV